MPEYAVLSIAEALSAPGAEPGLGITTETMLPSATPQIERATFTAIEAAAVEERPDVAVVARRMPLQLIAPLAAGPHAPSDDAWGLAAVGALASNFTGEGVTVAILDTGIDALHPAFEGVEIVQKDFTGEGDGDWNGHGTHCAGTILGRDVNGVRIGVARGVSRLLVGKVIGREHADTTMLFDAIDWAVKEKADVISMSLGINFPGYVAKRILQDGLPIQAAVSDALEAYRNNLRLLDTILDMIRNGAYIDRDPVVIAASGNDSRLPTYRVATSIPGAVNDVISVGALQSQADGKYGVTSFSNILPKLAAPGLDVLSAEAGTGELVALSGTSMACPHVAGVAALWCEALKSQGQLPSGANVAAKLLASARMHVIAAGMTSADVGLGMVTAP